MIPTIIAIIAIVAVIVQWVKSTQSKLVVLDENISNAMSQIGVQLSSRFDAMMALLDLTKGYDKHEIETIAETIKLRRKEITAKSKPDDILHQEGLISEALEIIAMVSEQYLELKSNLDYIKAMDAVQTFENMMRTSRLIYNDSVTKLNREIRMFPVSIISGMLGFRQRDYLEEQASKTDIQKNNNRIRRKIFWRNNNMKRKILSMILVLCMVLTMMPVPTMAVEDVEYNIWVGGVRVTSRNKGNITGDGITGTVDYDPDTNTLTLDNASISKAYEGWGGDTFCIYNNSSTPLLLKLIGYNFIAGVDSIQSTYGIYCNDQLTIEGEGSLKVTPGSAYITDGFGNNHSSGILTQGGLTINDTNLDIKGEQYGLYEYEDGNITINGRTVTSYGSKSAIMVERDLKTNGKKISVMVGDEEPYQEWDGSKDLIENYKYVKVELKPYFITDIAMTNATSVQVNTDLDLMGSVDSNSDTSHTIIWSVEDANGTGATINDDTFTATSAGTAKVKASVINGLTSSDNFTKTFDITVTAAPLVTHSIIAATTTGGSISPSGSVIVNNGESQTFTITPNRNYSIADVNVDGVSQGPISSYTFSNITEDHTISATFKYNGSGSGSGNRKPNNNSNPIEDVGYKEDAPAFTDIESHWAKEDIDFVVSRGLFGGTSDTTFSPDNTMTREMFVTVLGRLANVNVESYNESSFADVKSHAYYMGYIEWASKNNMVKGIGNGNFAPDQSITREQMAVIIMNYAKTMDLKLTQVHEENTFDDSAKISDYAKDAVKQMQMAGILSGKNGNLFDPQGTATRAEVSAVLHRFVELFSFSDTL